MNTPDQPPARAPEPWMVKAATEFICTRVSNVSRQFDQLAAIIQKHAPALAPSPVAGVERGKELEAQLAAKENLQDFTPMAKLEAEVARLKEAAAVKIQSVRNKLGLSEGQPLEESCANLRAQLSAAQAEGERLKEENTRAMGTIHRLERDETTWINSLNLAIKQRDKAQRLPTRPAQGSVGLVEKIALECARVSGEFLMSANEWKIEGKAVLELLPPRLEDAIRLLMSANGNES